MMIACDFDYNAMIASVSEELVVERERGSQIEQQINTIMRKNADLPKQLNLVLGRIRTRLTLAESDASQLGSSLSVTSVLAENVSGKVRELDVSKGRVVDCLQRVDDLLDLRHSTHGVQAALQNEDYEQAAQHIHRFLALDSGVFHMCKDDGVANSHDILKDAEKQLNHIITSKFDEAVAGDDVASMERFLKLYPLVNQHDLGISKFANYLRGKVARTANNNLEVMKSGGQDKSRRNVVYADSITLLFEGIARTVEIHQPIVQTYYGPDRTYDLVEQLQAECDIQAQLILDAFAADRKVKEKIAEIERMARANKFEKERADPLQLDVLLCEMTLLHTRAELYLRFIKRRVSADIASMSDDNPLKGIKEEKLRHLVKNCQLSCGMQELIGQYIMIEEAYMQESMHKAMTMDTLNDDNQPPTSGSTDDCFFLVRKCIRRALSSASVDCLCAVVNNACTLIDTELRPTFHSTLKGGYPSEGTVAEAYASAAAAYATVVNKRQMPSSGVDGADKARLHFLLALNNAQMSNECTKTLMQSLNDDVEKQLGGHMTETDRHKVKDCLSQLTDTARQFNELAKFGVEQLLTSAVRPRVKLGAERLLDYSHAPTEDEFNDLEANDPFVVAFVALLDEILVNLQNSLTPANYNLMLNQFTNEVANIVEKMLIKCTFNRLGGLQADKELRQLNTYLSSVCGWSVREKLGRLSQISSLLNVESEEELKELCSPNSNITWRLTPNEARHILALRIDLPAHIAHNLKF